MAQWCTLLWGALGALVVFTSNVVSWLLDNLPGLNAWWMKLPNGFKIVGYAFVTVLLGAGLWAIGRYALACAEWPSNLDIFYMIAVAALSWFSGAFRHERDKAW